MTMHSVGRALMIGALAAAALYVPNARAHDAVCDIGKAVALIKYELKFSEPVIIDGNEARKLNAYADHVPNGQSIIVIHGDRLFVLGCGPNDTWQPRHYRLDVEAERKFYNLAPPHPVEAPKQKRTRRADQ